MQHDVIYYIMFMLHCYGLLVFTEVDKISIKFLRENKHCRTKYFLLSICKVWHNCSWSFI